MDLFSIGKDLKYEVDIKIPAERKKNFKRNLPSDIKRPSIKYMEPIYSDGEFLYRIAPFSFKDTQGYMMACISFLYYGIAKYEIETGRLLEVIYAHTDENTVKEKFKEYISAKNLNKMENPYILYDLRISHGYLY